MSTNESRQDAPPVLNMIDVHKRFGDVEVLKGIDLSVGQGQVVSLIGSSGSGKTTLLRCVNLLEDYDHGEIHVDSELMGYRMDNGRRRRLGERQISQQRSRIGMVFQSYNLFPHMTAEQNIMLGLTEVQRKTRGEARDIARHWLDRVGLASRHQHYPYQLSGGQQQRVAIARAVAMEPRLMLFDEVTSALDPELVGEVLAVIQSLAQDGMTMLVVSHEMLFVREVSTHVVFMEDGRIGAQGPPQTLFAHPESARLSAFLGHFRGVLGLQH